MASMGDDQEENIEMWKIKKVLHIYIVCSFLFYLFLLVRERVFVCAGGCDERESPEEEEKMRWRFVLFAPEARAFECALFNPTRVSWRSNTDSLFLFIPVYLPLARTFVIIK